MATAKPGASLKHLRKTNGWTLAEVSKRTGIPPSTLSRIENDRVSPTYDLLARLSRGLSVDVAQLVSSAPVAAAATAEQQGRRSLNRIGDGELIEMSNHTLRYLSTDLLRKQVTPILTEYRARTLEEFGELMRHAGEEFLFVLEGAVELHTELYAPVVLKAGESVYFDSRMGHAYLANGPGPCRALSICVAPQEEMRKVHDAVLRTEAAVEATPAKRIAPITKQRRRRTG
ncbi:helix-turn-helix domain-containing protein [Steroidobacter sp.]|uniref:helix-turn-helix domain-containing protein n=1 Tax=Steroidobacter sp. TaxID=1978227 RepID=UPI001A5C7882|nr:XRE family transcriptional regulator [Steroidobacter sp.]MBL8270308.1 helix-turn-helix transcriptional regulator [Steroidobacter sp.]